jgi:hypothetical protein
MRPCPHGVLNLGELSSLTRPSGASVSHSVRSIFFLRDPPELLRMGEEKPDRPR